MRRPGGGCPVDGLVGEMFGIGKEFIKDKTIEKRFGMEASNIVKTVFEDVFSVPIGSLEAVKFTKGTLRTFQRRLNKVRIAVGEDQVANKFASLFYTPSGIAEKNPQLMHLMDNLHNVNLSFQGRSDRHNRAFKNILDFMKKQMLIDGYGTGLLAEKSISRRLKKATKKANDLELDIENLSVDVYNNVPGAANKLTEALRVEDQFYVKGEGKVFNETLNIIEKELPKLERENLEVWWKEKKTLKKKLSKNKMTLAEYYNRRKQILVPILAKKIKSEPMRNAVAEYTDLMDDMHRVLTNGIDAYVSSLKEGMKGKYSSEQIDEIGKKIKEKISPDRKVGYFPHYKRVLNVDFLDNLMPHMQKVSDAVAENLKSDASVVDKAVDDLSSYLTGRVKSRAIVDLGQGVSAQKEYSRNFFTTLKRYIDEIDRFNMVAHSDKYTRESLNAAKELFRNGDSTDGYARATVEIMQDMNSRMKGGYGFENENAEAAMKTLLALEFTSKLGFNVRSPAKNATQGLLNIVQYGPAMIMKSRNFYNNNLGLTRRVEDMMNEAGFLFAENAAPELIEGQMRGKGFTQKIRITDGENVEFKRPGFLSAVHNKVSRVAGFSGKLMAKVENFNRTTTFKVGFYKMYDQLNNSTSYKNSLREAGKSEAQIEAEILTRARNYAIREVTLLHFDYTDLAKSSWLLHPAGRLLGQFQHYGIKFLEYNIDIAKQGGDDILAGELVGERAQRAYRMGLTYFLAPAVASAATGLDFGNVIEHNVKEQIDKLWALFTGDEEEIKKAYYGKGVLTGLPFIGAPLISDAIALGNIWEFMDMDNETMAMLLSGYEDYGLKSQDQKIYETIRLLNVQLGRGAYKTLPLIMSGSPGAALQYELGLYKTKESKKLKDDTKALLPEELVQALALLEAHRAAATSKTGIKQQPGKGGGKTGKSYLRGKSYIG
jgi:hypothetical protein